VRIVTRKSLPRRTFLRGMGVTMALPLLDAMVPALTAMAQTPANPVRRLGVIYVPNGMSMSSWTPRSAGTAFELTPILQPLAPFRDRMIVFSGLDGQRNAPSQASHAAASTRFLTGVPGRQTSETMEAGPSIDQIAARAFGEFTPLASLELAVDARDISGSCDGASCAFLNTLSWSSATTALPTEHDPRVVFERMFGETGSTDSAVRLAGLRRHRSILDSITEAVVDLGSGLGPGDRLKVDEYLTAVRDIERRIQKSEERGATVPVVTQPTGIPQAFEDDVSLLFDLQVLAYQSDVTRVITFMIGREFSSRAYPQIGVAEAHHPLSHHQNDPEKIALLAKVNTYHTTLFASYLEKLRSTPDGDGSLLDHLLLLYGSGISDSNRHDPDNLPLLLLGSNQVKGGRHLRYTGEPAANLLVTILDKLGVPKEKIANSGHTLNLETLSGL
jgi:hypothetical protein